MYERTYDNVRYGGELFCASAIIPVLNSPSLELVLPVLKNSKKLETPVSAQ